MDILNMVLKVIFNAFLVAVGGGLVTLLVLCIKWIWRKIKSDTLTMKALAHDAYFRQARYILQHENIHEEELENHNYLYEAYKSQGLNGTGDAMHKQILTKKVIPSGADPDIMRMMP